MADESTEMMVYAARHFLNAPPYHFYLPDHQAGGIGVWHALVNTSARRGPKDRSLRARRT